MINNKSSSVDGNSYTFILDLPCVVICNFLPPPKKPQKTKPPNNVYKQASTITVIVVMLWSDLAAVTEFSLPFVYTYSYAVLSTGLTEPTADSYFQQG